MVVACTAILQQIKNLLIKYYEVCICDQVGDQDNSIFRQCYSGKSLLSTCSCLFGIMSVIESFLSLSEQLLNSSAGNVTVFPLPEKIRDLILSKFGDNNNNTVIGGTSRQFGGGGGCNDAYSAFAFLSFLFALLTFIQNNNGNRRKKRSTDDKVKVRDGKGVIY